MIAYYIIADNGYQAMITMLARNPYKTVPNPLDPAQAFVSIVDSYVLVNETQYDTVKGMAQTSKAQDYNTERLQVRRFLMIIHQRWTDSVRGHNSSK